MRYLLLADFLHLEDSPAHDHIGTAVIGRCRRKIYSEPVYTSVLKGDAFGKMDIPVRLPYCDKRTVGSHGATAEFTAPGLLVEELEVYLACSQLEPGHKGDLVYALAHLRKAETSRFRIP